MDRKIFYGKEATEGIIKGVDTIYNAVKVTLGAKGKTVLIEDKEGGGAHITKDGVTVAKSISVPTELERVAVDLIRTIALKTNEEAGDGTSSSVVLASNMIKSGFDLIQRKGVDVNKLLEGVRLAVNDVVTNLADSAIPVEDSLEMIENVATVSGNNDIRVGKLIAEAYEKVDLKGIVTVDNSRSVDSYIEVDSGMRMKSGLFSSVFIENWVKGITEYEEPAIIISDFKINNLKPLEKVIGHLFSEGIPVVLICEDIDLPSLQTLAQFKSYQGKRICVLKAPSFGEQQYDLLTDLAIVTGGRVYSSEYGDKLEDISVEGLGSCKRFEANVENSFFYDGFGKTELINKRIEELQNKEGSEEEVKDFIDRASCMDGGSATIYVGAWSDAERAELRDRVVDGVYAVRAAISEGIVAGGGSALYHISRKLASTNNKKGDTRVGYGLLCAVIQSPLIQILNNAGINNYESLNGAHKNMGIDVLTGEKVNMIKQGIIDPVKVVRIALQNAVSVATTLLTTECVVSNLYSDDNQPNIF